LTNQSKTQKYSIKKSLGKIIINVGHIFLGDTGQYFFLKNVTLRGYHTLQGDNSLKSVEPFDYMIIDVCMQISSISVIKTTERKDAMWLVNL